MASTKIERLLGIIFLLINRDKITAKELSDTFSVSIKTIYRDIETLSLSNIPVISYSGVNGGYGIIKDYIIDKNVFSYQEVVSAISVLGSITSFFKDPSIVSAAEKLAAVVNTDKKNDLKKQAEEITFDLSSWGDGEPTQRKVNIIRDAIKSHHIIEFNYTNLKGESLQRIVEPVNILFKESAWYMKGFCRVKEDIRTFKITRISDLKVSKETYVPDSNKYDTKKLETNFFQNDNKYVTVLMRVSPEARVKMADYIDAERIYEKDGLIYVKVTYPDEEELYYRILGFGDKVEVLEPDYIKEIIKERAKKVYDMY